MADPIEPIFLSEGKEDALATALTWRPVIWVYAPAGTGMSYMHDLVRQMIEPLEAKGDDHG